MSRCFCTFSADAATFHMRTSRFIPAGSLDMVGHLKEDERRLKGPNWIMIRLKEHFKIHYVTNETDVSLPCRHSTFLFIPASAVWLTHSKNSIMSTRRPTDDLLSVCSTYTTHIQPTSCAPTPQIHFKQQLILCYCLLTWHQRHIFPAEAQSTGRDSLGRGTELTWTGGGRGEGGQQELPRADWLKSPKFSATTTDHNCWRPLEVWGQVCLFCLQSR